MRVILGKGSSIVKSTALKGDRSWPHILRELGTRHVPAVDLSYSESLDP